MAKITVIIPCYNAESYIERCVHTLEEQSFKDFEAIIIDDCSSDTTTEIIEEISKKTSFRITLIKNRVNLGPAASRNIGICNTESEYITFCDCDDWYEPDFLKKLYSNLIDYNSNLVFCGYKVVNEVGKKDERPLASDVSLCTVRDALCLDSDSLCMMMVKTSIMKSTLLPDIRNGEDMAIIPLLIMKAKGCVALPDCLYNYYRRSDSASQSLSMSVVDSLIESFRHICEHIPEGFDEELEYLGVRNLLYSGLITLFTFSYNREKGKEILECFEKRFSNWSNNPLIDELPKYKRVFLVCVRLRFYLGMKIIAMIRKMATRNIRCREN